MTVVVTGVSLHLLSAWQSTYTLGLENMCTTECRYNDVVSNTSEFVTTSVRYNCTIR